MAPIETPPLNLDGTVNTSKTNSATTKPLLT